MTLRDFEHFVICTYIGQCDSYMILTDFGQFVFLKDFGQFVFLTDFGQFVFLTDFGQFVFNFL